MKPITNKQLSDLERRVDYLLERRQTASPAAREIVEAELRQLVLILDHALDLASLAEGKLRRH